MSALPLLAAYPFAERHGLEAQISAIRSTVIDSGPASTVRRGYVVALFREKGLLDEFIDKHWPSGRTSAGAAKLRYYDRLYSRDQASLAGHEEDDRQETDDASADAQEDAAAQAFALEAHLRDYLAANLTVIEPGLRLYSQEGKSGIEYPVDGGRIDILAVARDDKFVVIELKLSRGRNRALGQLCYYMGWIDEHLGSAPCRGVIVASEISEDLSIAARRIPGASLFQYRIALTLEPVN